MLAERDSRKYKFLNHCQCQTQGKKEKKQQSFDIYFLSFSIFLSRFFYPDLIFEVPERKGSSCAWECPDPSSTNSTEICHAPQIGFYRKLHDETLKLISVVVS
jgi:hypothetical protein